MTEPLQTGETTDAHPAKGSAPVRRHSDLDEGELIRRAKTDPHAFASLYEAHYSRILNYIFRRTLDPSLSEDLTSETFFKALRGLRKFRRGSFQGWLYKIATNEIRMHWRSARTRRENDPKWRDELRRIHFASHESDNPEDRHEKMREFILLRKALLELPPRYQTVLVLRYFEDLPYSEIAQAMGKRLGTVKSLVHRGVARLRELIENEHATFSPDLHLSQQTGGESDEE
jgi:RNA polymerase sigma-70 factor (ECF subfamily)